MVPMSSGEEPAEGQEALSTAGQETGGTILVAAWEICDYSARSASTGSMPAARLAGR
jgi:hypothetical protein